MNHVRIEYTLRDDVDVDAVKAEIRAFVRAIGDHDPTARYTSFQDARADRHFVHIGQFDPDRVAELQRQPFFGAFTGFLRERCATGPAVTPLAPVASTR